MTDFLELASVRRMVSPVSVEEYHGLPEYNSRGKRTELVRGLVIEKVGKTPLQCFLLNRLARRVREAVGERFLVMQWCPITMRDSEPEPDLSVIDGQLEDSRDAHPTTALLAVEVADTTVELDRAKAELYAEAGVPEFWLVLAQEQAVEVHTHPRDGEYARCQIYPAAAGTLACASVNGLHIDLAALFAH